jgi:hypothetical protein
VVERFIAGIREVGKLFEKDTFVRETERTLSTRANIRIEKQKQR